MLAGSASGFIFKLIGSLVEAQKSAIQGLIEKQGAADASHDAADKRGGTWVRRMIVTVVLFAVVVAPFVLAHSPEGITVGSKEAFCFLITLSGKHLAVMLYYQKSDKLYLPL